MALCSLSTGKSTAPERLVASINSSPDMIQGFLLASNTRFRLYGFKRRYQPCSPNNRSHHSIHFGSGHFNPSKSFMPVVTWILSVAGKTARNCFAASSTICATFLVYAPNKVQASYQHWLATNPYTL